MRDHLPNRNPAACTHHGEAGQEQRSHVDVSAPDEAEIASPSQPAMRLCKAAAVAGQEVRRLLDGGAPSGIPLCDYGEWSETVEALQRAQTEGGTSAARIAFGALTRLHPGLVQLAAADSPPGPLSGLEDDVRRILGHPARNLPLPPFSSIHSLADVTDIIHGIMDLPKIRERNRKRAASCVICRVLMAQDRLLLHAPERESPAIPHIMDAGGGVWPLDARAPVVRSVVAEAGINVSERAYDWLIGDLDATSRTSARRVVLARFWRRSGTTLYISSGPRQLVRVAETGVDLLPNGADGQFFVGDAVLPGWVPTEPVSPFRLAAFSPAMTTHPDARSYTVDIQKLLLEAFLVALLADIRPLPLLAAIGDRDGGKTSLIKAVALLLAGLAPTTVSGDPRDLWALAARLPVLALDNADGVPPSWLPDLLAALVTGVSYSRRKLYTNAELDVCEPTATPLISTRTASFARPDVAQRTLPILTRAFRDAERLADTDLMDEVRRHRAGILTYLAQRAAQVLARIHGAPEHLPGRFVDFARVVWAFAPEQAVSALTALQQAQAMTVGEADSLLAAIIEHAGSLLEHNEQWRGRATDLISALRRADATLPHLGGGKNVARRLREGAGTLALFGLHVQDDSRTGQTIFTIKRTQT